MRAVWITAVLAVGCSVEQLPPEDPTATARSACSALEGMTFRAVDPGECGLGPEGPALCHYTLQFQSHDATRTGYVWRHSDVGEGGWVTCAGDAILDLELRYEGHLDDQSMELVWDGSVYALVP